MKSCKSRLPSFLGIKKTAYHLVSGFLAAESGLRLALLACMLRSANQPSQNSASWELRDLTRFGFSSFLRHKKRTFTLSKCSFFGCGIRIATRFARVHASFSQSAVAKARLLGNYAISPGSGSHPSLKQKTTYLEGK